MESKRLLLAAVLSLGVLFLWERFGPKPSARTAPTPATQPTAAPAPTAGAAVPVTPPEPAAAGPEKIVAAEERLTTIENPAARATFSNRGAVLTSFVLRRHTDEARRPLELVHSTPEPASKPLAIVFPGSPELTKISSTALYAVEKGPDGTIRFRYADDRLRVTKEVRLGNGYLFDVHVDVAGGEYTLVVGTGLRNPSEKERASSYVMPPTAVASTGGSLEKVTGAKLKKIEIWPLAPKEFVGIEDNYFLTAFAPKQPAVARIVAYTPPATATSATPAKMAPLVSAGITASGRLDLRAFFGPKDVAILETTGLGLERTVDFGWFGILARPLLWLLKKAYSWAGNYGLAILLVTLLIRILLFPLMHKSYASMKKMQKLAPKMNVIRDKYKKSKTDAAQRQKMNAELMALYQAEGYNPMSGCFPVLLQLPILVAFYNVLSRAVELRHAPFVFWIKDLSAVDRSYLLVILMIVTMYIQQAMTPSTVDPVQKKIFMAMPLLWGFMLKEMPSGLVLYWLFSNVLTILQQMLINRMGRDEDPKEGKPARLKPVRA
ncbi:MAG: membrane protein insertase YidC [Acidobacteriota bacterium]